MIGGRRPVGYVCRDSKRDSQTEFNLAPAIRLNVIDLPESSVIQIRIWVREMGRIGEVVGLNTELPLDLLRKGDIFEKRQVHV